MPTNEQVRNDAAKKGATCWAFEQPEAQCSAWVTVWLRKQFEGRNFQDWHRTKTSADDALLQKLFVAISENDQDRGAALEYITSERVPDTQPDESKLIARRRTDISSKSLEEIESAFKDTAFGEATYLSVATATGAHAVGFACLNKKFTYFDPNVGEFEFPTKEAVGGWWKDQYEKAQGDKKGPFSKFRVGYRGWIYERLPTDQGDPFGDVILDT